ncbi:MAG TPA: fibronectin type III domain-containing protein [Clostridiaceae bacterium]|nr:fibronectin type III domain-containing protein [Clostridiaceae bacterium]
MQKIKRLLSLILIAVLSVTQLPVSALVSGTEYTTGNVPGFSSTLSSFSGSDNLMAVKDEVYKTSQSMALASTVEDEDSGLQYSLSLKIELNEIRRSMSVQADINSFDLDADGGKLVVTLYDNEDGIPKLIDFFTAEVQSGVIEDTPDTPEAIGVLSFDGVDPENLVVSGIICRFLDEPVPLSAAVSYDADGFIIVPVPFYTLDATDVTKTSAVLHGQVVVEDGAELNAADFGFLVFDSGEADAEEIDEDGNPVGVILPYVQPAASITSDGFFSLPLTNLESGREYQYMAVGIGFAAYGEPKGFTTKSDLPAVDTGASAEIDSQFNVVTVRGAITDTKGFEITESGVMFGTSPDSGLKEKSPNQSGLPGVITCYIGQLDPGKTYYYRAYAKSDAGIGYGKTYSFTMPAVLPTIKSRPSVVFDPVTWKANFSAEIISDGGAEISEFGFRLKLNNGWKHFPSYTINDSKVFTLELEGHEQIPFGNNEVEAYVTNTVGTATMAVSGGGFLTPSIAQVNASLDNTLVTVSSAVLKGNITIVPGSECLQRGFEYKAVSDSIWIEAGMETGRSGEYTFTLEGLRPYTGYVFRAKAQTLAGWSYSSEIVFSTIFSDNGKETAYQMKMDGKTGKEILEILKNNLHQSISEACVSLKFAGFDAFSIAAALKPDPYKATYKEVAKGLLAAGFDASTAAKALQAEYLDVFQYEGGDITESIITALDEQGYPKDDVIKALREVFNIKMDYIGLYLGISNDEVYDSLIHTYGAYVFSADFWREHYDEYYYDADACIRNLTMILKNCTTFSAGDIAAVLKEVYPQITAAQFVANCRQIYPAASDMGDAIIQAFGVDPSVAAKELHTYSDIYTIEKIKDWLINKRGLSASQTVKALLALSHADPLNTIPVLLKDDLGITTALDAARAMYEAGWKEDERGYYGYWRVLKLLINNYGCTASDLIEIMKELGLSPLAVAQQMEALKTNNYVTSWIPEYRSLGYAASELVGWYKTTFYYAEVDQAVIVMGNAGYSLDEITAALKQVYALDAGGALTILKYSTFTDTYKWWTEAQAIVAVDLAYNTSTLDTVINQMKTNGATAVQIANTLKEAFAVTEPGNVAGYLIGLGYDKNVVLQALAQSFRTLKNPEFVQMLSNVLRDKFSQEPMDNMALILSLYESVKGKLNHAVNGAILLHNSGFGLRDITLVFKNDIDALNNVSAPLTAFEAGQLLLGLKAYGFSYNKLDIFAAIQEVYGVNFMLETVIDYKNNKKYPANTAIAKLSEEFGVDAPSAAAKCLKEAGYTMAEVLEGFIEGYSSEKSIYKIDLLRQVLADIYPEEQAPFKAIMEVMEITDPGHVSETLYKAGFSVKDIIMILQNEYGLSSGEVTEYLYERNFENIILNVEDVYGGNGYLDFILYRKNQGDSISQLFDWLYKKFRVADISQIMNTLKLAGFSSEDVITLLYEKQRASDDETILQVQDIFGEDSIQSYINHRKSKGDSIAQVFSWLQKFGVKDVQSIISYLTQAGYSSSELIEFLFSGYAQVDNAVFEVEGTFGKNAIVEVLKQKKTQGWNIGALYRYLKDTFRITNLTQIAGYLKALDYASSVIMDFLYQVIKEPGLYGEIIEAVQAANAADGTDVILGFLRARKEAGEGLSQLNDWIKDKFNITDMTQTVAYLKAVGYTNNEIIAFWYERYGGETGEYEEVIEAIQAASNTDITLDFLREKKEQGEDLTLLYSWLKDKFSISDISKVSSYFLALGYASHEIIEFLFQQISDSDRYKEIVAAVQAATSSAGSDTILEFLRYRKSKNNEGLTLLYGWMKDKFGISDIGKVSSYLLALGYSSNEIIEFLYQQIKDSNRYEEIVAAVQAATSSAGSDAILEFLKYRKSKNEGLPLLYGWMKDNFGISDIGKVFGFRIWKR